MNSKKDLFQKSDAARLRALFHYLIENLEQAVNHDSFCDEEYVSLWGTKENAVSVMGKLLAMFSKIEALSADESEESVELNKEEIQIIEQYIENKAAEKTSAALGEE